MKASTFGKISKFQQKQKQMPKNRATTIDSISVFRMLLVKNHLQSAEIYLGIIRAVNWLLFDMSLNLSILESATPLFVKECAHQADIYTLFPT